MNALLAIPAGFAPPEPWPARAPIEGRRVRSPEVLRFLGTGPGRHAALDPYSGCELACAFCRGRDLPPFRDADFRLFERDIHVRVNAAEALAAAHRSGQLHRDIPLVLGASCEPWQPLEAKALATRAALEVALRLGPLDLRAQTRATLAARDADLLVALGRRGRVRVGFGIPALDRKLTRFLEPLAPTPDRRLVAMESLARAGVSVGIVASPLVPGLNDAPPALDGLLARARSAGATWAAAKPLRVTAAARTKLLRFLSPFGPELAARYDRLFARSADLQPDYEPMLARRFKAACDRYGLISLDSRQAPELAPAPGERAPQQLSLF